MPLFRPSFICLRKREMFGWFADRDESHGRRSPALVHTPAKDEPVEVLTLFAAFLRVIAPREHTSYPVVWNCSLNMSELPPAVVKRLTKELIELQVSAPFGRGYAAG